jgi:DivIVA domain-containing protein
MMPPVMDGRVIEATRIRELEIRGRYLRRRSFGGYRSDDVDAFLVEVGRGVRELLEENEALRTGVSPSQLWSQPSRHLTPQDVEDRRLGWSRVGGYDMRSVDEYLDEVAETLAALAQENETLRRPASEPGGQSERERT